MGRVPPGTPRHPHTVNNEFLKPCTKNEIMRMVSFSGNPQTWSPGNPQIWSHGNPQIWSHGNPNLSLTHSHTRALETQSLSPHH